MFDPHTLTNMQPITKKPKIPTLELCTADAKWSEANKFYTWAMDVPDYLMVHHIQPEDEEALPYAAGYLGGLAKEFVSTWRKDPLNKNKKFRSFLNDLRVFCIPTNYKGKLWEEFNNVNQRGRPIQEVANELCRMRIRLRELSGTQMDYQLKAVMDMELHTMVAPHIHPQMEWQEMIDLIVRYDDSLRMKQNRQYNSYPRNNYNNKSAPSLQNRGNFRNNKLKWNRNKKPWTPKKKPFVKNNNWKPKDNNKPKTEKDLSNITCFKCNTKGHYANTCPEERKPVTSTAHSVLQRTTYRKKPFIRLAATDIQTKDKEKGLNQILDRRSEHMVIDVKLDGHPVNALVDQQTTGASLMSSTYTSTYNLPIVELPEEVTVNLALQGSRGKSTHYVITNLDIGGHTRSVTFSVAALADWDMILGELILREHKTKLDIGKSKMAIMKSLKTPIAVEATTYQKR